MYTIVYTYWNPLSISGLSQHPNAKTTNERVTTPPSPTNLCSATALSPTILRYKSSLYRRDARFIACSASGCRAYRPKPFDPGQTPSRTSSQTQNPPPKKRTQKILAQEVPREVMERLLAADPEITVLERQFRESHLSCGLRL
jgi:hypothetical protein